jgi:hypothetical protein
LLSIVMAIAGAYLDLSLAVQIADAAGSRRRLLLAGATVIATGSVKASAAMIPRHHGNPGGQNGDNHLQENRAAGVAAGDVERDR